MPLSWTTLHMFCRQSQPSFKRNLSFHPDAFALLVTWPWMVDSLMWLIFCLLLLVFRHLFEWTNCVKFGFVQIWECSLWAQRRVFSGMEHRNESRILIKKSTTKWVKQILLISRRPSVRRENARIDGPSDWFARIRFIRVKWRMPSPALEVYQFVKLFFFIKKDFCPRNLFHSACTALWRSYGTYDFVTLFEKSKKRSIYLKIFRFFQNQQFFPPIISVVLFSNKLKSIKYWTIQSIFIFWIGFFPNGF